MTDRRWSTYENGVEVASGMKSVSWDKLRLARNQELRDTDHWALKDRTMSQAKKDYRVMLRDLPSDFEGENANQACDHWNDNPRPEE